MKQKDERIKRVIRRVGNRLDTHGWRQMRMGNERDGYCLVGAVKAEVRCWHPVLRHRVYARLKSQLPLGDRYSGLTPSLALISWNDRQWSRYPVLDAVERAGR